MCRIASLCLLQRLKGSMSGDARGFNSIETGAVINQWSGGIAAHPAPKNSECKNPLEKFSPRFFWDQGGILLTDYLPKGQTINADYYLSLLVQLKDILKEKAAEKSPRGSCSCTIMSRLTGHLQPRRNWTTWVSNVLITHPVLRIWPRWITTCSLD